MRTLGTAERVGRAAYMGFCAAVFVFLIAPILAIMPLSFNAEPYFTFTEGMLRFDPEAYSLRWYREIATDEAWTGALVNSLVIGTAATVLATPFVVITVTATLTGYDRNLSRAAASLGAGQVRVFRSVQLPLIAPGIVSGGLFAFATSFDEVVAVLFLGGVGQRTIPRQMWAGIREHISPAILAVATFLIVFAVCLLLTVAWLRKRAAA